MSSRIPKLSSLSAQMILSFIALVLLTAAAVGLPALWLIRSQLNRQALAQVGQGSRAAQALYEARESEMSSLATLTAQRPTLHELLLKQDEDELSAYLDTLQTSLGLDLILICGSGQQVAKSGEATFTSLCDQEEPTGFHVIQTGTGPQAWLFATHPIVGQTPSLPYAVLLGQQLDDEFAIQMRDQTGLEHTVLVEKAAVASSLPARQLVQHPDLNDASQDALNVDGRLYYIALLPLGADGIQSEVALEITDIAVTQRRLAWTLVASILVVTVVASAVGTFLARRISSPLAHLAEAADAMSRGDMDTPMTVEAQVREVALVAQALDGARADLKRTLTELRQEKAWTDHLLESIVEGIVTLDRQGRITFFSHGAEQITGWRRDEVLERSCDQVFHPIETDQSFSQLIPAPGRRQKISIELRDGRHAILAVTGGRLLPPARGNDRVALVFRDVSEEEAIHRLLGHFLANVELLLDQAPDLSPAELEELLTSLHLGVLGLQTLIDNLLESASIETGHFRVHPRPSSLGGIIADAVSMMQPLLDKHGQRLVVELPVAIPTVRADPRRTVQVVINLLSNASKYGPDDAEIEVTAIIQGQWAKVTIADSGPGVPPEVHKNLFRRFVYPSPTNDRAQVGVGLGLSVVKAIIEGHGGEVGVDQRQGGGSAFWFTLPLEDNTETLEDRA
jgi:two-component system phosphate regulon sensor histidine kinase PhoR